MTSVSHATLYANKRIKTHPLSYRGGIWPSVSVESVNDANPLVNRVFINCNGFGVVHAHVCHVYVRFVSYVLVSE